MKLLPMPSRSIQARLARIVALACVLGAAVKTREVLLGLGELDVWRARVEALAAAGADLSCGFVGATIVHRIRTASLHAFLLIVATAPLLVLSRSVLAWALAAAGIGLALVGTTYGLPPNVNLSPDAEILLIACMCGLASVAAAPATDSGTRTGRIARRMILGVALSALCALQATSLPGSAESSNDRAGVIFLFAPTAFALFASAVAIRRRLQPDAVYRGLPAVTITGLLVLAQYQHHL